MTATTTTRDAIDAYFRTWQERDFGAFRANLADDATFRGPLGTADDGDECAAGIEGMSQMLDDIVVQQVAVDGDDAITWFELHTKDGKVLPVANWSHVTDGKVDRIQVTFDPRPLFEE